MKTMGFPFLTLPDPETSGEGAIDPLGMATVGDHLAEEILPGLRARMSRPRFVTAMAVAAAVCEGIEEETASDGTTPAYLVFEWLLVEAFVRAADRDQTRGTAGILKAAEARQSGEPMSRSTYLRIPTIFGFHGIYKPLARHVRVVYEDMRLADDGYALLKEWQADQSLPGFLRTALGGGEGRSMRDALRSAVQDGLKHAYTSRSGQWRGWELLARHLVPSAVGARESTLLRRLLVEAGNCGLRGEVFRIIEGVPLPEEISEANVVAEILMPRASAALKLRLHAVVAYETLCTLIEDAFDWIRYLSTKAGARAVSASEFASSVDVQQIASRLPAALRRTEDALAETPLATQHEFGRLATAFGAVSTARELFDAVLEHHHQVQQAKKPDGKRDWFERAPDGATIVRIPYRLHNPPEPRDRWSRPYRIKTVQSFLADLEVGAYETA
jgi:hypothetical protein